MKYKEIRFFLRPKWTVFVVVCICIRTSQSFALTLPLLIKVTFSSILALLPKRTYHRTRTPTVKNNGDDTAVTTIGTYRTEQTMAFDFFILPSFCISIQAVLFCCCTLLCVPSSLCMHTERELDGIFITFVFLTVEQTPACSSPLIPNQGEREGLFWQKKKQQMLGDMEIFWERFVVSYAWKTLKQRRNISFHLQEQFIWRAITVYINTVNLTCIVIQFLIKFS